MPTEDIWTNVAAIVDRERRHRDLTTRQLAHQAGIDASTARRTLAAQPIRLDSLRAVTSSLSLDWDDLLATLAQPQGPDETR